MHTSGNRKRESQGQSKSTEENFFAPSWQRMGTAVQRREQVPSKGPCVTYDLDKMLQMKQTTQRQEETVPSENRTGMPNQLKNGLEQMSGFDLSGVRVHRNSAKPAQLNAHAYAQGQEIHLAPGQEKHLPHEGWHVVQQMQGRVKSTMEVGGESINDDVTLEQEADVMGAKAASVK